jgi:hypothetical protein
MKRQDIKQNIGQAKRWEQRGNPDILLTQWSSSNFFFLLYETWSFCFG